MERNDGDHLCGDDAEVAAEALADATSRFIECSGLKLHYKVEQPQVGHPPPWPSLAGLTVDAVSIGPQTAEV